MLQQTTVKTVVPVLRALPGAVPHAGDAGGGGRARRARGLVRPRLLPPRAQPPARRAAGAGTSTAASSRARWRRRLPCRASASTPRAPCSRSRTACRCRSWTATCAACWRACSRCAGRSGARTRPFYNRAEELLDRKAPGDWNQAVMELGATVCLPRKPACPACPLRAQCQAAARGLQEELPEARSRRAPVNVTVAAALVEKEGRVLLVRRAEGTLDGTHVGSAPDVARVAGAARPGARAARSATGSS